LRSRYFFIELLSKSLFYIIEERAGTALLFTVAPHIEQRMMPMQMIQTLSGRRGTGPVNSIARTNPKVPTDTSFRAFFNRVGTLLIIKLVKVNDTGPKAKIVPISQSG
jgi:hypothetical protein